MKGKEFWFSKATLILDPILKHEYSADFLELDPCGFAFGLVFLIIKIFE